MMFNLCFDEDDVLDPGLRPCHRTSLYLRAAHQKITEAASHKGINNLTWQIKNNKGEGSCSSNLGSPLASPRAAGQIIKGPTISI